MGDWVERLDELDAGGKGGGGVEENEDDEVELWTEVSVEQAFE